MRNPITVNAQARALRSLTGLPLSRCRRIILMAADELRKGSVRARHRTISERQLSLDEIPASPDEIESGFARIRMELQEVRS